MAANMVYCRICKDVLPCIRRRNIFSDSFKVGNQLNVILGYVCEPSDGLSAHICLTCHVKLTKMLKIYEKSEALRMEKEDIVKALKTKLPQSSPGKVFTPTKTGPLKRRVSIRTPTPRKPKKILTAPIDSPVARKNIFKTSAGTSKELSVPMEVDIGSAPETVYVTMPGADECQSAMSMKRSSISCLAEPLDIVKSPAAPQSTSMTRKQLFSPGHMHVQHRREKEGIETRIVKNLEMKNIIRSISRGDTAMRISKKIFSSKLHNGITTCFLKKLKKECTILQSGKATTLLRQVSVNSLKNLNFANIDLEFQAKAPLFHKTLSCLTNGTDKSNAVAGAVTLFSRSNKMSLFQHIVGQILDHCGATDEAIQTMNKLGLSVSVTAVAEKKVFLKEYHEEKTQKMFNKDPVSHQMTGRSHSIEIIGDNIDITRNPSQMSKERRTKSWHWFMLLGVQKRVLFPALPDSGPQAKIMEVENACFVPSVNESESLEENFIFHIMHILVTYVKMFESFRSCLPRNIEHPYQVETSQKSTYDILDLLDKSENKSDEMITIMEHIHEKYVPRSGDPPVVSKKVVFGGDCLTNERAYSAQLAMNNSPTDFTRVAGVIHRPEGLHRMMNLCLFIYQQFYKSSSANDAGTLYQLRNVLGRVNVHGPNEVVGSYRAHYSFLQDCLDGYVVCACMKLLGLTELDGEPAKRLHPLLNTSPTMKYDYLYSVAKEILDKYVKLTDGFHDISSQTVALETEDRKLQEQFHNEEGKYVCEKCGKAYKTKGHFKSHIKTKHDEILPPVEAIPHGEDLIEVWRSSFMKCALLLKDTNDAYKNGDGFRIIRNAKFEMLLADVGNHTKYKLWYFRFQAYYKALLSKREAMEYIWNCTSNTEGGIGKNIPNDNLVEMTVHAVKKKVQSQGANATFNSARKAALAIKIQTEIKQNMMKEAESKKAGKKRPTVLKPDDIKIIVRELNRSNSFNHVEARAFEGFANFKDPFSRVKVDKLCQWLTRQKKRLFIEMVGDSN